MSKQQIGGERSWYAIHTYAGYENAVARNLKQRIESLGMEDRIFNVLVPTETKIKIKGGKRVEEEEKIYPGYVLVDMIVNDDSWYVVRNTPRVTGFVGSGVFPVPLEKKEVDSLFARINKDEVKHTIDLVKDENVKIVTMTQYNSDYPVLVAYNPIKIEATLAKEISNAGMTQAHIAETGDNPFLE